MRTFEELSEAVRAATKINDAAALEACATELELLETAEASATAALACGTANRLRGDYQQALKHFRRALQINEDLGDRIGVARVMNNIGNVYKSTGDYPQALEHYRRALHLFDATGSRAGVAHGKSNPGNVYQSTGDIPEALEHYRQALALYEELGDCAGVATVTANMGMMYRSTGDYPKALELYRQALQMRENLGNRAGAARITGNMGNVYRNIGDHTQALEHYRRALQVLEELGNRAGVAVITGNIGNVYLDTGDYPQSLDYFRRALMMHEELEDRANAADVTSNMVSALLKMNLDDEAEELLQKQSLMQIISPLAQAGHHAQRAVLAERRGELDAAWEYLQQALKIVAEVGARNSAADHHKALRDLAQKRNDFAAYIEHNNAYQQITDEVHGKEATQKLAMLEADKRIAAERAETEKHKALLYNTLPPSIADRVLRGEVVNDNIDMAAVLFMDLVGFTTMSSTMDPGDVVTTLSSIFSTCDAIMAKHGLMKIKTIGDSYMAVAFPRSSPSARNDTSVASSLGEESGVVEQAANAALEMLDAVSHIVSPNGSPVEVRLGLHCGAVTAGVIGTERLQYDVWGDTVNVASRMESTGEPGRVHVSEQFASFLGLRPRNDNPPLSINGDDTVIPSDSEEPKPVEPGTWHLARRGDIEVKGKGLMTTYWLERRYNFREIQNSVELATSRQEADRLLQLADALHSMATLEAYALEAKARASAHRCFWQGAQELQWLEHALVLYEKKGDLREVATVLQRIGNVHQSFGDFSRAHCFFERALAVHEELGISSLIAGSVISIAYLHEMNDEFHRSLELLHRALELYSEDHNPFDISYIMCSIGQIFSWIGDYSRACDYYERALIAEAEAGYHPQDAITYQLLDLMRKRDEHVGVSLLQLLLAGIPKDDPISRIAHLIDRAKIAEYIMELDTARDLLKLALQISDETHLSRQSALLRSEISGIARCKSENTILASALPDSVVTRLLRGEFVTDDHFNNVSVLFLDIAGFSEIRYRIPSFHTIRLLKAIFKVCDEVCKSHGLTMIKTIGDSFLAVGGAPDPLHDHVQRTAQAALMIQCELDLFEFRLDPMFGNTVWTEHIGDIIVRIGLHTGPVNAGVIGTDHLLYDVWGDTVELAARLESTGEPGRIHVSEAFASFLADARNDSSPLVTNGEGTVIPRAKPEERGDNSQFPIPYSLRERGEIEIKGKGSMTTYWLEPTTATTHT